MKAQLVLLAFLFGFLSVFAEPKAGSVEDVDPFAVAPVQGAIRSKPPLPKMIRTQVEFIELSHEALTKLLFLSQPKTTDGMALRKTLQDMVGKDEAKVLETQVIVCRNGQKATNESIHEFIYPTEYQPPSLPCGGSVSERSSIGPGEHALPTAFETRNLGCTLEVEPLFSEDDKVIDLRLVPEIVWHTGNTVWLDNKDVLGNPNKVEMPDIYTIRLNTAVICVAGQYQMVSVLSPKDAKGETDLSRKVLVFVKCDVLTVK